MAGSTYTRQDLGDSIVYEIASSQTKSASTDKNVVYFMWGIWSLFLGWLICIPILAVTIILHLPSMVAYLIGVVLAFLLIKRWRKGKLNQKLTSVMGRDGKTTVTLSRAGIEGTIRSELGVANQNFKMPLSDVRRFRMTNTLRDAPNTKLSGGGQNAALGMALAQPTSARAGVLLASNEIGRMRAEKAAMNCYAVMIDHQNTTVAMADRLDQLTATNLSEDAEKDFRRFAAA